MGLLHDKGLLQVRINLQPLIRKSLLTLSNRWPAIVGIIIAVLVFFLTIFCCIRCCTRRRRGPRGGRNRANTASMFNPAPYQGYQPANNPNNAPPPYGEPARFAQFDAPSGKKVTEDSLPAMPSWDAAQSRRVEQEGEDVEMGHLEKPQLGHRPMNSIGANTSSVNLLPPTSGFAEADSHPVTHDGQLSPHYTGPDFGHGKGHPYTGPDFGVGSGQQIAYSAYAPSESTKYEPSGVNEPQEMGTTYSNTMPPPSPGAHQQGFGQAPGVLQAGRRPGPQGGNSWREV